jgi:hypothetical protein
VGSGEMREMRGMREMREIIVTPNSARAKP